MFKKGMRKALKPACFKAFGGEGGIRTHVGFYPQLDFEGDSWEKNALFLRISFYRGSLKPA